LVGFGFNDQGEHLLLFLEQFETVLLASRYIKLEEMSWNYTKPDRQYCSDGHF